MRTISFFFYSFVFISICSCSSLTYLDLPVYEIEGEPFPAIKEKLVLVNNAAEQPEGVSSFLMLADNKQKGMLYERDSANFPFLNMLGQQMLEDGFMEDVIIYNTPLRSDSIYRSMPKLSSDQLKTVVEKSGADWILSLDAMPHVTVLKENIENGFNLVTAFLEIQVSPVFRLYKAGNIYPVKHYYISDTIAWNATSISLDAAIPGLPSFNQCFMDALYMTAEKVVRQWMPYASSVQRCWVNHPHSIMREAQRFLLNQDLESAGYMLEYGYEKIKDKRARYYAAYNRAVLAEMNGEFENALIWLDKACILESKEGRTYPLELDKMKSSLKKQYHNQQTLERLNK